MKKSIIVLGLLAALASNKSSAAAKVGGEHSFWMGLALDGVHTGANGVGAAVIISPSVTAMMMFNDKNALQAYLNIPTVQPFLIGFGLDFKHSIMGTTTKGFHIGGGIGLGTQQSLTQTFFINIAPGMGIHFEIAQDVLVNLDSSLAFKLTTNGTNTFDMSFGGNSIIFGGSILMKL